MKHFGIVSYNIYCNFTNYGSALQSWALYTAIKRLGIGHFEPALVDYCPDVLLDSDPLDPYKKMWDKDEDARRMCELSMPAVKENYYKFDRFYHEKFIRTGKKYTSTNFNEIVCDEQIDGFVCGSDTIFCILEFHGFDDGYFANYDCMKGRSIAYAASFGDAVFDDTTYLTLCDRLRNFKALGLREDTLIDYVRDHVTVPVKQVIDPTLLLTADDYDLIADGPLIDTDYVLLYTRRYDPAMEAYAETLAKTMKCKIVEISLRAENEKKGHIMCYQAGVEEFLSLVKYSQAVITNSFHGLIFGVHYRKPIHVFIREQADRKIGNVLRICGLEDRSIREPMVLNLCEIDYDTVLEKLAKERKNSLEFLEEELKLLS